MFLTVVITTSWFADRQTYDKVDFSWFLPGLGCLFVPIIGNVVDYDQWSELSWFWFATGAVLYVILLVITFQTAVCFQSFCWDFFSKFLNWTGVQSYS